MKKILIIRFSSIGDIVLTTPVIRCLKKQTGAEIHYLTKQQYLPLLAANPYLDKVYSIEKSVTEVLSDLKKEQYSCIVDLHKNLRSWQVRLALRKRVFAFKKLNWKKWLLVNFKADRLPKTHIVDRYLAAVNSLDVKNDGEGLDYFFPKDFPTDTVSSLLNLNSGQASPFIAFAIGAAHATKRLPTAEIIKICQATKQQIILLGGPAEFAEGEKIAAQCGPQVINACGKLNLHESAAIIRSASKVIAHDTGMMHIAAAFGKEILSVWGSTVPAFGMSPYFGKKQGQDIRFEAKDLDCRPCSKIGFQTCPKGHFKCMKGQDIEAIILEMNTLKVLPND